MISPINPGRSNHTLLSVSTQAELRIGKNAYWRQGYLAQDAESRGDYHEKSKGNFL
jgi:hypothetical protein